MRRKSAASMASILAHPRRVRFPPHTDSAADIRDRQLRAIRVTIARRCAAAIASLFDHLVGAGKQRWRYSDAERLSGLVVDHELIFGRRLNRKIGGLGAFEDAI